MGAEDIDMNAHAAFLVELSQALQSNGLADNLGLCSTASLAGKYSETRVEFTSVRANITLPFNREPLGGRQIDAAWRVVQGIHPSEFID